MKIYKNKPFQYGIKAIKYNYRQLKSGYYENYAWGLKIGLAILQPVKTWINLIKSRVCSKD
jgi:hypothetical protein